MTEATSRPALPTTSRSMTFAKDASGQWRAPEEMAAYLDAWLAKVLGATFHAQVAGVAAHLVHPCRTPTVPMTFTHRFANAQSTLHCRPCSD